MNQPVTFTLYVYQIIGGGIIGSILLGVLLAIAFYKRSIIRDLINDKM